ncbi:MAG: four helix bundle protein [Planctomycetota bacterium]
MPVTNASRQTNTSDRVPSEGRTNRPRAREAPAELRVLQEAEEFATWLLQRTARWPKSSRATLTLRIEELALSVLDDLVQARYRRAGRADRLEAANLSLERTRYLFRIARNTQVCSARTQAQATKRIDGIGRMLHGWRSALRSTGDA